MCARYFEEFDVGDRLTFGPRTITGEDIADFTRRMGVTKSIFRDPEAAAKAGFSAMVAPGPLTLAVALTLTHAMIEDPGVIILLELSKAKFPNPLRHGDTISNTVEIVAKRATSKPKWGILTLQDRATNQDGQVVCECERLVMVERRPDG